jgi:pimeloyl-ACP methyl ester carboxylesterase
MILKQKQIKVQDIKTDIQEIWFIHGAASTCLSFNWLKEHLDYNKACSLDINYSTDIPLSKTINDLADKAKGCVKPPIIIGHSLGGVIAVAVAQKASVKKIVSISSPFGGSFAASVVKWFMPTQLFKDICQQSPVLAELKKNTPNIPILSIVTDSNLSIMGEDTDGVVTVRSQVALIGPKYVKINLNHFEVLLSEQVSNLIQTFIDK